MGNILRRVAAFLLGIVFTVTSLVGGVVGGAYYAYKNVSPLEGALNSEMQESLGDLYNATIEEWLDLINNAQDPGKYGEYTFARLAEEYGFDLAKLLEQLGLDVSGIDQDSEDWKALEEVSLLSILASDGGIDKVLESVKLKALYVLAPAVLGGPIDNYLSPEAQSALGDYSISDLLAADEATGELGIVQAIKGLKIGSFLPEIFEASFDVKTNEYVYTVKQDGSLKDFTFLNLIGSVPLQGIFNIVEGGDVMTELFEGEFKSITSLPVSEILGMFADVAGEETANVIKQYTQVFGDVTVRDLFEANEEGKYEFAYENLLSGLELGYLFGYTKTDGEWLDKDGNAPTGLLGFVAGISIGDILNNEGDVIGMINAAAGDLTIKTIYETIVAPDENGDYPMIIERLGTVKVSDVLGGGAENIVSNLKISLRNAFDGATLYEIVALFGEDLQNKLADIPIVDALLKMEINSFIRDEYDLQSILYILSDALGDLTVGDVAKQEPTDDALGLLWKYELSNIIEGIISLMNGAKPGEIASGFIGQYTVGEIFGAFTGYAYNEAVDNWGKDGNYIAEGLVPLMKTSVAKFAYLFEENPSFDMFEVIGDIQIADVAYTALQVAGMNDILEKHVENGDTTYLLAGNLQDFAQLSKVVLTITVNDLVNNATNVDFWLDRARQITLGDLSAYVINNLLPVEMELIYNKGQWVVTTDYLANLMSNVFNTSVGGIIDAVSTGDAEVIKQKIFAKLGETNVGDIVYAGLGLAGVKDVVVSATSASGYALAKDYSDFNNIAEAIFGLSINNIIDNATDVNWWFEKLGDVKVGDAVAYFINKFAPDMSATLENGDWNVTGNLGAVLTGLFNVKVSDLRDPDAVQLIKDAFGTLSIGDVCGSFVPEDIAKKALVDKVFKITVNNIIDMVNSENMGQLVLQLQDAFDGMTLRNVLDLFDIQGYDYGLFERILSTEFEFLFGLLVTPDIMGELTYEFGDISLGEIAYTALKVAGIENVLTEANGAYYAYGDYEDFESLSRKVLSITVNEVLNNLNADYWIDRAGQINVGDLTAYVVNKLLPIEVELIYNKGQWLATTDYLADLIANVANTTIGGMIDTFTSGDAELIKEKVFAVLGDTNVGDIVYAVCGLAKLPAFVQASDNACGYELATEYADFNNLAQAVMGLKLTDIVSNATSGEFWLNAFSAITVGDLADYFIPDELEANAFMAAVRNVSVDDVNGIVKAETAGQRVALIQDAFDAILVSDILSLANINEINNSALKKLADTELVFLIGLAITPDIIGEIAYEFGDITLGDAITTYVQGAIDIYNPFIDATLGISVEDVIDIATATSVSAMLDTIYNIYVGVMIGDVVNAFYTGKVNVSAIDKVYALLINDVIKAIEENNIINFLYEKFGDVALAELALDKATVVKVGNYSIGYVEGAWMATSANTNLDELLTNVLNTKLGTIYDNVASQENLKNDLVTLLGGTTIGEAGELAYTNAYGIGFIDKLYDVKLADIASSALDGTFVQFVADFIYDLSINDFIGFMLSESLRENAFVKATLAVDGVDVYNIAAAGGLAHSLLAISDIYEDVTLGDVIAVSGITKAPLSILEPVFNAGLDDLIESIARGETVKYVIDTLGNISVNNIVTDIETIVGADIIPASIEENKLVKALLGVTVYDVYAIATNGKVLNDVGIILDGVTLGDVVSLFMTTDTTFESLATLYTIDIGKTLIGLANGDSTELLNTLTTAFNQLPNVVKYSVFAAAGVTVVVLYFANNPLLCQLSDQFLGEGTTWGDLVASSIGYAKNDEGEYENYIGYNGLMNTLLSETVTETITTGYPLFNNIKAELTLGNLLTAYVAVPYLIENSIGMNFVETVDGGLALDNEFYSLADALFNIALGDFLTEENKFLTKTECNTLLYNTFGTVNLGDFGAYFFNLYAKEGTKAEKVDSAWVVNGEILPEVLASAMNISLGGIYRAIKANDKAYYIEKAKELFGDTNLGDVTYAILTSTGVDYIVDKSVTYESGYTLTSQYYELDEVAQCFFGIKIADIVENASNRTYWRGVFGELTIGDFANYFIPDELETNDFIKATTSITANVAYDLIKSASAVEFVNDVCEIYEGVTVYDLVSVFVKLDAPSETVKTIFNVSLSDLVLAIMDNRFVDFLYKTFGDEKIGNVVFDTNKSYLILGYTVLYTNDAWKATSADGNLNELFSNLLNVTLGTIYDDATAAGDLEKDIAAVLGNTTVGEIGSLLYKNEQNIGVVTRIYNVKLANIVNSLFRGTTLTLCKDLLFDVTLHDLVGFLLNETVRENAFVKATLSINTNKVIDIVNAGSTEAVINRVADLYTAVTFADVMKLFNVNEAPVAVLKPVFAASVEYFIRAIADNTVSTYVLNVVGEVNVGDVVYSVLQLVGDTSMMSETKLSASGYVLADKYDEFNRLAQKAFAISVRNVVDNIQNGEYWIELVKDIALGDVVGYFIPEDVEAKKFMKATLSITVENVMNMANAADANALVKELQTIYTEDIELHDLLGYDAADALGYDLVTKIFDTDLYFLLGLAVSEDPLSEIRAEFGDITLGDALTKFYASENVFVKATYSLSVDHLFEVLATTTAKDALAVIASVYKNVTIGDILKLANVNEAPVAVLEPIFAVSIEALINAAASNALPDFALDTVGVISVGDVVYSVLQLIGNTTLLTETKLASSGYALAEQYQEFNNFAQKVLGITVRDLVDNVTSRSYWYELFKDVKIGDLVNYFIPDDIQSKKFIKTIVSITAETIYDVLKAADNNERVAKLQEIFKNLEIHDVFGYDEADALGYDVATKVMDTDLSFLLGLITSTDRLTDIRMEFGDITLGDALTRFYASENDFVKATYSFSVDDVFKILDAAGVRAKLNVVAKLYEGVTAQDALQLVTDYTTTRASVNEALKLDLGVAAQAVLNREYSYFRTYAKSVYNVTTRNEKLLIAGVAGVGGAALYFINNELLCKAIDKVLGPDATWGDILADNFGYALTSEGYTIDGLHNELMNTFFSQNITTVLQDGYPFGATFRPLMTIGNLVTVHSAMLEAFNKLGLTIIEDEDQDLMFAGDLANITKSIFALGLNDFMPTGTNLASAAELKDVLGNAFGKNVFGDVLAVVINRQNFVSLEAVYDGTQWVVLGTMGDFIGRCLNVSFAEALDLLKNKNYSIITDIIGDMTLLDFASVVKKDIGSNPTVALVLSLKVKDLLQVARGKESITSLVGGWTFEELAGNYLPESIDKNSEFAETLLNMTLSELNAMRKGDMKAQIMDKFGEFTFAEALASIKYDASTADALIADILQLKLNIFDGGMNAGIDAIMDTVKAKKIGVFLEYEYDEANGVWLNGGAKVTGIMATLADISIKQITDDPNFFNNMTLGEALGYEFDGVDWIDGEGNTVTGIMAAFADVTIGGLDEATLKSKVNNITLGEVMTIDATSHKVLVALKDTTIGELSNAMNDLELGEVIEIDASSPQVLQTLKTEKLGDLTTAFNDLTLGEVIEIDASSAKALQSLQDKKINELSTAFNDLTLGEVIEIDGSNTILKALEDSKITDMSNDINDMYLGTIMGYEKAGDVWVKSATTSGTIEYATGIARVLVDKQVKDLTNANFATDLVDELTVGDVFPEAGTATATDPLIKFIEADWKINELGTKLSAKFNSDAFTVQTAIDLGIFGTLLNDGNVADGCYGTLITTVYGNNTWKTMAVSEFIEYILVKAFVTP